uniref:Uncharacterized protein n=1 Tax=Oryza glumipatula TaxID=40148 RepID=A0A0E0A7S7_9ORYZ
MPLLALSTASTVCPHCHRLVPSLCNAPPKTVSSIANQLVHGKVVLVQSLAFGLLVMVLILAMGKQFAMIFLDDRHLHKAVDDAPLNNIEKKEIKEKETEEKNIQIGEEFKEDVNCSDLLYQSSSECSTINWDRICIIHRRAMQRWKSANRNRN